MNRNLMVKVGLGLSLVAGPLAFAIQTPQKLSTDARIEVVNYDPYNVVPVHGTTFTTTQIIFGKHEYIENVQNGDLGAWTDSISKTLPYMMFIKPNVYGSNTNMTVITNKHTYYFRLISNEKGQGNQNKATYAIHFAYPGEKRAKVIREILARKQQNQAELSAYKNPSKYNWDYSFNGDRSIMPIHVFDDGKFTYMQLQPNEPTPAVFAVMNKNGKESVVNYRMDGQYIVVQRTAPQFTLRLGKGQVASIFNEKQINKLQGKHHFWL